MRALLRDWLYFLNNLKNIVRIKVKFKEADIRDPLQVAYSNINNIDISKNVFIDVKSTIRIMDDCKLSIGEGTYIGPFSHLSGTMNSSLQFSMRTHRHLYIGGKHSDEDSEPR